MYATLCTVLFIYRKVLRLSYFWRSLGMIIFFGYTCRNFEVSWTTISLLYLAACVLNFILCALFPSSSKTKYSDNYLTIYSALGKGNSYLYNRCKGYSRHSAQEEERNEFINSGRVLLCALVPLWLIYFLSKEAFNNSFRIGNSFYSSTIRMKNKIITIFKNIKAA
jgi:hypothetical protein